MKNDSPINSCKEKFLERTMGRMFWEAVLASGITYFLFKSNIKEAVIFVIYFVLIFFIVITLIESFFDKK